MRDVKFWVVLAVVGCAGDETTTKDAITQESLSIVGAWTDDFGSDHDIDEASWVTAYPGYDPYVFEIDSFDATSLIAQNGADNAYSAGLWSRFDWVFEDGDPWYCQTAFAEADAEAAAAVPAADSSNVDGGCGGFPFTHLMAR